MYNEKIRKKVIFLLNNFKEKSLEELPERLVDMKENLNVVEKADDKLLDFIEHMEKIVLKWKKNKIA